MQVKRPPPRARGPAASAGGPAAGGTEVLELEGAISRMIRALSHLTLPPSIPLERSAFLLLRRAAEAGPIRTTELAALVFLDVSTVSRQAHKLVAAGLLRQTSDPSDGRASRLEVTGKGSRVLASIAAFRRRQYAELLGDWSGQDLSRFVELLDRFSAALHPARQEDLGTGAPQ